MLVWGAMWCEINGGGVRKRGRGKQGSEAKGRQQRKEKGIHALLRWEPQLEPFLKTFKSEPSTTTGKTLTHTLYPHLCLSTPPEQLSATSGPLWRECMCVRTLTTCVMHMSTVCVCVYVWVFFMYKYIYFKSRKFNVYFEY